MWDCELWSDERQLSLFVLSKLTVGEQTVKSESHEVMNTWTLRGCVAFTSSCLSCVEQSKSVPESCTTEEDADTRKILNTPQRSLKNKLPSVFCCRFHLFYAVSWLVETTFNKRNISTSSPPPPLPSQGALHRPGLQHSPLPVHLVPAERLDRPAHGGPSR